MRSSLPIRRFHVGEVLSVITGVTIGREGAAGGRRLMQFMVGVDRELSPAEQVASFGPVRAALYWQVPGVEALFPPEFRSEAEVEEWLVSAIRALGCSEEVDLVSLPLDDPGRDLSPEAVGARLGRRVNEWISERVVMVQVHDHPEE